MDKNKWEHPLSEQTIIKHNGDYKGTKYINDLGEPCFYSVIKNNVDTLERVKYYGGRLLSTYSVAKQPV